MDVLNGGIVHAATASGLWIQGGFKYGTKDGRADLRPVEILAGLTQQQVNDFLRKPGDNDIFICEQTTVNIGKSRQIFIMM